MPMREARRDTMSQNASRRGREIWPKRLYMFVIRSSLSSLLWGKLLPESKLKAAGRSGKGLGRFLERFGTGSRTFAYAPAERMLRRGRYVPIRAQGAERCELLAL